jgi:hypothetical protein
MAQQPGYTYRPQSGPQSQRKRVEEVKPFLPETQQERQPRESGFQGVSNILQTVAVRLRNDAPEDTARFQKKLSMRRNMAAVCAASR